MAYQNSDFKGDEIYAIEATGDCCVGDEIRFEQATFTGSYRNAKFAGFEMITAKIIRDSYGAEKQQHTFTLELEDGSTKRIKGRNLYKNGVWRKKWADESARQAVLDEKHKRGDIARAERAARREENEFFN